MGELSSRCFPLKKNSSIFLKLSFNFSFGWKWRLESCISNYWAILRCAAVRSTVPTSLLAAFSLSARTHFRFVQRCCFSLFFRWILRLNVPCSTIHTWMLWPIDDSSTFNQLFQGFFPIALLPASVCKFYSNLNFFFF